MTWFRSNCCLTNLRHLCAGRRKQVNQTRSHLPCSPGRAPRCRTRPGASDIIRKCLGNEGRGVILFGLESCGSCQGAWPDLRLPRDPFAHQKRSTKTLGASTSRPAQAHRAKASAPQAGAKAGRPIKGPSKRTCKRARPGCHHKNNILPKHETECQHPPMPTRKLRPRRTIIFFNILLACTVLRMHLKPTWASKNLFRRSRRVCTPTPRAPPVVGKPVCNPPAGQELRFGLLQSPSDGAEVWPCHTRGWSHPGMTSMLLIGRDLYCWSCHLRRGTHSSEVGHTHSGRGAG